MRLVLIGSLGLIIAVFVPALLFVFSGWDGARHFVTKADAALTKARPTTKIHLHWQIPARGLTDLKFSPDGAFIGYVDKDGTARCYDNRGMLRWSKRLSSTGSNQLLVGSGGNYSVVYSLLNPVRTEVQFLDQDGNVRWAYEAEGSPWCVAASPDRNEFTVGTGEGFVYVYTLGKRSKRFVRWQADGVPTSISYLSSDQLLLGCWQDSSVGIYGTDGDSEWSRPGDLDKLYYLQGDDKGDAVLALAFPNRKIPRSLLLLMDRTGSTIWRKELQGLEVKASVSPTDRHTAVGFLNHIEHNGKQVAERHVVFYDDAGNQLWDKGGMFFKPRLLAAASNNSVLVYDESSIYVIDRKGKVQAKIKLPSPVRGAWSDRFGKQFIILGADNRIYYYTAQ